MIAAPHPPQGAVRDAVARALDEDLLPLGDLTGALVAPEVVSSGRIVAREAGVVAGCRCVTETFVQVDPETKLRWHCDDGDRVAADGALADVSGRLVSLLAAERTALNFLGHLSGIATETGRYVEAAAGRLGVWDTRKTTPGLRGLEKAAVRAGGGANHRANLSDWVMLKDNHLSGVGITEAVRRARTRWPGRTVHVECDALAQCEEAAAAGADAILLDNMSPDEVRRCVEAVRAHDEGRGCLLEVSGGIRLDTVAAYADTGVDMVSVGAITNSAPVLDIGLDIAGGQDSAG